MTVGNPYFLAFFFGIFHLLGGLALGRGVRAWRSDPESGTTLIFWGLLIGVGAGIFDWVFLLREGQTLLGVAGGGIFIVAAVAAYFLWDGKLAKKDEKSLGALLMGSITVLVGIAVTPILIAQAQTRELTLADWVFGPCIAILPFFVGINFIFLAVKALRGKRTFDEVIAEEEEKQENAIRERRVKKKS